MRRVLVSGWLAVCALVVLALLASAPLVGAAGGPGGNNGTVKIHGGSTETEPVVRNEPHVCTFHLHFLFADPTQAGVWEIRAWAPRDKGDVVLSGPYDTSNDGVDREPHSGVFSLANGHYKLFWKGRNEQNLKHKAFWVECAAPTTGPTALPSQSVGPTASVLPNASPTTNPSGEVLSATGTPTGIELPATDAANAASERSATGLILILLAGIGTCVMILTSTVARTRR
jgi:hypothetical protein